MGIVNDTTTRTIAHSKIQISKRSTTRTFVPSASNKSITSHRYFPYQSQQQSMRENSLKTNLPLNLAHIAEETSANECVSECDIFIVYKRDKQNEKRNVLDKIGELEKYLIGNSSKYPQLVNGENAKKKKKKEKLDVWATTTSKDEDFKYNESFRGAIQASKFIVLCK
jgi:hypothetical protein